MKSRWQRLIVEVSLANYQFCGGNAWGWLIDQINGFEGHLEPNLSKCG